MSSLWQQENDSWWLRDFIALPDTSKIGDRNMVGTWQKVPYETTTFSGNMLLANPGQQAPEIRVPLPVTGRYSVGIGLPENYADKLLLKLERHNYTGRLMHGDVALMDKNWIQEVWWQDLDLEEGDALLIKQDAAMRKRSGIAYIRLYPAPPPTAAEVPFFTTADGSLGNNGAIDLDEMMTEELQFEPTHISAICHGTDICGLAEYKTKLPGHRYPFEYHRQEAILGDEYYPWGLEQAQKYEDAGRCPLRDSVAAAHAIGRPLYAYHRMAQTRIYAPMRMWSNPLYDEHPKWHCTDFDGVRISRMSVAFPEVRRFFLDHFRETIEYGADGVCLVLVRGWPLILFEQPVAEEFTRRTGKQMHDVAPDDPDLLQVRTDFVTGFIREIRQTVDAAAPDRKLKVVALPLATPEINRFFAMDCEVWAREGLVDIFCPYPYGYTATPTAIDVPAWAETVKDTNTQVLPILNRMTYEPAGIVEMPLTFVDRAHKWLAEGAHGFSYWDMDAFQQSPVPRRIAYNIASAEGRRRLREIFEAGPIRHQFLSIDGLRVDRYHPGWNV